MQKVNYDAKRAAFFKAQHDAKKKAEAAKKVAAAKAELEYRQHVMADLEAYQEESEAA